jgi:hypothetical protein
MPDATRKSPLPLRLTITLKPSGLRRDLQKQDKPHFAVANCSLFYKLRCKYQTVFGDVCVVYVLL